MDNSTVCSTAAQTKNNKNTIEAPHYWPFVRGIHKCPVVWNPHTRFYHDFIPLLQYLMCYRVLAPGNILWTTLCIHIRNETSYHWSSAVSPLRRFNILTVIIQPAITETQMPSFWRKFRHWLHLRLSSYHSDNFLWRQCRKFHQNGISPDKSMWCSASVK